MQARVLGQVESPGGTGKQQFITLRQRGWGDCHVGWVSGPGSGTAKVGRAAGTRGQPLHLRGN